MRQVVLDTETTGLETTAGHRIIEIGCVELVNRRYTQSTFHRYINPERAVDPGALEVHGLDNDFLSTQPTFEQIADEFLEFIGGAELVIHNAEFDIGFLNHELGLRGGETRDVRDVCQVLDTLTMARRLHPGQRNSLDALAKRYEVDNSRRELHGALLDAEILAEVYLAMTGGQVSLSLDSEPSGREGGNGDGIARIDRAGLELVVLEASEDERAAHEAMLEVIRQETGQAALWDQDDASDRGIDSGAA